jgi:glycosyltransferase involved in cell wall biosynthesis
MKLRRLGEYDVIWGNLYFGNLYALLLKALRPRARAVISMHGPGYAKWQVEGRWQHARVDIERRLGLRYADTVVAVSQAVADDYSAAMGWSNITVIHNGIPVSALASRPKPKRSSVRERFGIDDSTFVFVIPSRFVPHKGYTVLLDAVRHLIAANETSATFLAVGLGPQLPELITLAKTLGVDNRVRFIDTMSQPELFDLVGASDAVIVPSLREPFGIVAAEAMALGAPAILSAVDGLIELAGSGAETALMVPPNHPRALADAIRRLETDAGLRTRVAAAGRKRIIETFDISACADAWASLLTRVARSEARRVRV